LYPPLGGRLEMDGEVIDEGRRDWFMQHVAAVFSDAFVFPWRAATSADVERMRGYIERFDLQRAVKILPEERAIQFPRTLSSGQRKPLALAMALLSDRPIYIFDEWAAEQDVIFRDLFYRDILPDLKRRGKAVMVISHDDRYFDAADRIVALERGRPMEPTTT